MIQLAPEGQHRRAKATEHGPVHAPAAAELGEGSTAWSRSGCSVRGPGRGQDPTLVPLGRAEMMGAAGEPCSGKQRQGLVCVQAAGPESCVGSCRAGAGGLS